MIWWGGGPVHWCGVKGVAFLQLHCLLVLQNHWDHVPALKPPTPQQLSVFIHAIIFWKASILLPTNPTFTKQDKQPNNQDTKPDQKQRTKACQGQTWGEKQTQQPAETNQPSQNQGLQCKEKAALTPDEPAQPQPALE